MAAIETHDLTKRYEDDVVAGKLLGRSLVTATAMTVGFAVASVLVVALSGQPDAATFAGFVGSGLLLGLTFTGLAVGGSAGAVSRGRARTLTNGSFMGMVFFWKPVVAGVQRKPLSRREHRARPGRPRCLPRRSRRAG